MKMFLGEYDHSLDERGRITLPKKIRLELDATEVILSRGFEACIFGFDRMSWEVEAAKHLEEPVTRPEARNLRRYMFSSAERVETDRIGRIVLPAHLKEHARITGKVAVIGAGDHFEIWDPTVWETYASKLSKGYE